MIPDNRPLSSSDASSQVPILLRRTLDSSFCRDAVDGIPVEGRDTSRPYKSDFRCSDLPETLRWYRIEFGERDESRPTVLDATPRVPTILSFFVGATLAGLGSFGPVE